MLAPEQSVGAGEAAIQHLCSGHAEAERKAVISAADSHSAADEAGAARPPAE